MEGVYMPSRSLPPRPNLEQLKKQAKTLLKAHRSGDVATIPRLRQGISNLSAASDTEILNTKFSLLDAQLVIAREQGFQNWQELEAAVQDAAGNSAGDAPPIQLSIGDIRELSLRTEAGGETPGCLVLLEEEEGDRHIPMWIGMTEAHALVSGLRNIVYHRPLTHDMTTDLLQKMQAKPVELRITDWRDQTFYATLTVHSSGVSHEIDCRPSDGLCIAVREGAPIVVTEELMAKVGQQTKKALNGSGIDKIAAQLRDGLPGSHVGTEDE